MSSTDNYDACLFAVSVSIDLLPLLFHPRATASLRPPPTDRRHNALLADQHPHSEALGKENIPMAHRGCSTPPSPTPSPLRRKVLISTLQHARSPPLELDITIVISIEIYPRTTINPQTWTGRMCWGKLIAVRSTHDACSSGRFSQ